MFSLESEHLNFPQDFFNGECHSQDNFMYLNKINQRQWKKSSARLNIQKINPETSWQEGWEGRTGTHTPSANNENEETRWRENKESFT